MTDSASPETSGASESNEPSCEAGLAEAVRLAKVELQKAQAAYDRARQQAAEHLKAVRETKLGAVCDQTLECVKRHPGAGLTLAALVGFYLGRLLGRKR